MRGLVTIQSVKQIGSGNGLLQIGDSILTLQGVGSLEGSTTETVTRETLQLWDGTPQLLVHEEVSKETAKITCTLKEKNIKILCRQLGLDVLTDLTNDPQSTKVVGTAPVPGSPGTPATGETKVLWEENWNYLYYCNVITTVGSEPVVVLKSAPTIALISGTDYVLDPDSGALRRVEGGGITDGAEVIVHYEAIEGEKDGVHTGGTLWRKSCRVRFVYPVAWGGRQITEYAKAFPAPETVQAYQSGNWNMRELSFEAAGNMTLPEGQRIRRQYFEKAKTP
jgi:hypothetical protein